MSADNYFINDQNSVYFLTFTIVDWVDVFTRKEYKFVIADSLNYCIEHKGLEVFAWRLMSNHLHLVCRAMIVGRPEEYLYSSARDYSGEKGFVNVQIG